MSTIITKPLRNLQDMKSLDSKKKYTYPTMKALLYAIILTISPHCQMNLLTLRHS